MISVSCALAGIESVREDVTMTTITCWSHRCRTNVLFAAILVLGAYALVFDKHEDVTGIQLHLKPLKNFFIRSGFN